MYRNCAELISKDILNYCNRITAHEHNITNGIFIQLRVTRRLHDSAISKLRNFSVICDKTKHQIRITHFS